VGGVAIALGGMRGESDGATVHGMR
jgi:hypothetical protein